MKLNFKCSNSLTVDIEVLQNSIFHLRIAPEFNTDKISALDRYSYLGNVPEDENAIIEQNDDILKIKTTDAALAFDKKNACFELSDRSGRPRGFNNKGMLNEYRIPKVSRGNINRLLKERGFVK